MAQFSYLSVVPARLSIFSISLSLILLSSREERQGLHRSPHSTTTCSISWHGSFSSCLSRPRLEQVLNWSWMSCNLLSEHGVEVEVEVEVELKVEVEVEVEVEDT